MWTYILKKDIDELTKVHPILGENLDQINLLETKDAIFVPKLLYYTHQCDFIKAHHSQKVVKPEQTYFKFTKTLRPEQVPIVDTVLNEYKRNMSVNGIIKARPGIG